MPPKAHPARFMHAAEEEFAGILDFYEIRWEYEPRTFPLEWDAHGRVTLAFAPDFYLPDQDLYVELTTMKTELVTKKNKKLRLMTRMYPDIHVKLFKRREIRDLMSKYGLDRMGGDGSPAETGHGGKV